MTQHQRILRHMADYGSITSAEAFNEYGILRLASRIGELKMKGYPIKAERATGVNRYGETTHFSRYSLIDESQTNC